MKEIIIWETNTERIKACEKAAAVAIKTLGLEMTIIVNSEPPLISRNQLWDRLPVLEIEDCFWSLHPGQSFEASQLIRLFDQIFCETRQERK
jgi:hypothetical protein